jgi:undecaprenyl diphosphate synthase
MQSDKDLLHKISLNKVPHHIAVIMDGNGRWAKEKGEQRVYGHAHGVQAVKRTVEAAIESGVKVLTLYAFSTENWLRPKQEVNALLELFVSTTLKELEGLIENGIRLMSIGDKDQLPENCRKVLSDAVEKTQNNDRLILNLAISYSAKHEITQAVKRIGKECADGQLLADDITPERIAEKLYTADIPDPDLLIRTSGEQRLSNFLLWQLAYAEFYFTETLWPDFNKKDFYQAIFAYQNRERRFGKTGEQIQPVS